MENASDRGSGVDIVAVEQLRTVLHSEPTMTPTELVERQLDELRRSYQVDIESLGLPVLHLTFPNVEESQPVNDVDDELPAPDDWIPPGEQHEI